MGLAKSKVSRAAQASQQTITTAATPLILVSCSLRLSLTPNSLLSLLNSLALARKQRTAFHPNSDPPGLVVQIPGRPLFVDEDDDDDGYCSYVGEEESEDTILTDYEKLADFIPSLAVSKLIDKKEKFARLYQIGQQNLAFGLQFNAKAILDCYERDLQILASGEKRDIEFKMTEGDFHFFEGKWCIEQVQISHFLVVQHLCVHWL
ncbi:POLYKETIDE CYCLASE / DEHYDRASE AND LIPID TRANSPORT PROTEIN [Salix koriyanagi]|uniref:POLYKETIDE CYCLASE / DEHYDRASE AND LIPID TRANSPORT PROTEIN n=1 Tax=Salix koriyanagi TaxID=2511006 RepID=A0A9Q0U4I6_9ROSI|nr:POLYKETIDE CYCLASE / DEHYDRASE AND LIPID TRANSPORT PROTEIN [Salix koriyanagi]